MAYFMAAICVDAEVLAHASDAPGALRSDGSAYGPLMGAKLTTELRRHETEHAVAEIRAFGGVVAQRDESQRVDVSGLPANVVSVIFSTTG